MAAELRKEMPRNLLPNHRFSGISTFLLTTVKRVCGDGLFNSAQFVELATVTA
jgi:hypothetical protein